MKTKYIFIINRNITVSLPKINSDLCGNKAADFSSPSPRLGEDTILTEGIEVAPGKKVTYARHFYPKL